MQRGYDQVIHDVCIENQNVVFAVDRAGLVGGDGATHQGIYDISFLRALPNMSVAMPKDADEMQSMLKKAIALGGPKAIRWPRGSVAKAAHEGIDDWPDITWGNWETVKEGADAVILAAGVTLPYALEAAKGLDNIGVVNARFIKPLDKTMLLALASKARALITVEDHALIGGLGSAVAETLSDEGVSVPLHRLGIPDLSVPHGDPGAQHEALGYGPQALRALLAELGFAVADRVA